MLDIGCGTGRFLAQLAEVAKAWGVDASPEMLEVARSRVGGAGLKLGTAEELPFKDGWFERATMWLVAHLVDRPRAFAEAARVLEPGGRFAHRFHARDVNLVMGAQAGAGSVAFRVRIDGEPPGSAGSGHGALPARAPPRPDGPSAGSSRRTTSPPCTPGKPAAEA